MQAKGQDIRAVHRARPLPGDRHRGHARTRPAQIKSAADFKGAKIGVTAPGSSTALTAQYAMVKAGLKATDAAIIGVGGGAERRRGDEEGRDRRDLASRSGDRQARGRRRHPGPRSTPAPRPARAALFGGSNPAAVLYTKKDFIEKNPNTTQRLVNAFMKALKWIESATPEEVADVGAGRIPSRRQGALPQGGGRTRWRAIRATASSRRRAWRACSTC